MIYCDTSLVVGALTAETASEAARNRLEAQTDTLAISQWPQVEVASALDRKARSGTLNLAGRRAVEHNWRDLVAAMTLLPIDRSSFAEAAEMVSVEPRRLRACDAIHFVIVLAAGCDLVTLDRDLADAARGRGVTVHPVRYPVA